MSRLEEFRPASEGIRGAGGCQPGRDGRSAEEGRMRPGGRWDVGERPPGPALGAGSGEGGGMDLGP